MLAYRGTLRGTISACLPCGGATAVPLRCVAGAVLLQDKASAAFDNSTFHNNQAYTGYGGAIHTEDNVNLTITGSSFTRQKGLGE